MKRLIILSLLLACMVCACDGKKPTAESKSNTDTTKLVGGLQEVRPSDPIDTSPIIADTLYIPNFSEDSTNNIFLLQDQGTYHGGEIVKDAENKNWIGLFNSKHGYYTAKTKIRTKHVFDGIIDEDTTVKTGVDITTLHKDTTVLLISGIDDLPERKVTNLITPHTLPHPEDDTLNIEYKGSKYQLYANAIKRPDEAYPGTSAYYNYKLFLKGIKNGEEVVQIITATPNAAYDEIIFMGDLDGDDIPDLIFNISGEDYSIYTLYLSKPAKPDTLLKIVAHWGTTGC